MLILTAITAASVCKRHKNVSMENSKKVCSVLRSPWLLARRPVALVPCSTLGLTLQTMPEKAFSVHFKAKVRSTQARTRTKWASGGCKMRRIQDGSDGLKMNDKLDGWQWRRVL